MNPPRPRDEPLIVGRLVEHGAARYQFRASEDLSYFAKILTQRGERVLWGKDLERAIQHGQTQPNTGDMIGARRVGRDAVTVTARHRDAEGKVLTQTEESAHRYRWAVEKVTFFAERARLARRVRDSQVDAREEVKSRPELLSTFLTMRGAEEVAKQRIADPRDREEFLALVREAMARSIKSGEPLPAVKMQQEPSPTVRPKGYTLNRSKDDDKAR